MTKYFEDPKIIEIPKHSDHRGNLSVVDSKTCLPFELKRVFYVYDIPSGIKRGGHAHRTLHQFLWCLSGSVKVYTINSRGKENNFSLSLPWKGLYIPPMTWAYEESVSAGCVYMVGASDYYIEDDYIRSIDTFNSMLVE